MTSVTYKNIPDHGVNTLRELIIGQLQLTIGIRSERLADKVFELINVFLPVPHVLYFIFEIRIRFLFDIKIDIAAVLFQGKCRIG